MNRRAATAAPDTFAAAGLGSGSWAVRLVAVLTMAVLAFGVPVSGVGAADVAPVDLGRSEVSRSVEDPEPAPDVPVATESPIATNDFLPEDRNLTDCIGVLQRPGCGSEARGGWRQTLVFVAVAVGLVVIFGNIARGVRRRTPPPPPAE